ncbi:hypothetical protein BA897_04130 [Spiribacter roseus]|nr:hypothetical protein BA897_04130 [Spiribacter roseus]
MLASGFPIERIEKPDDYYLIDRYSETTRDDYDHSPGATYRKAYTIQGGAVWISKAGSTSVAAVHHAGLKDSVSGKGRWMQWEGSDGSEEVGGRRYVYKNLSGFYTDMLSNTSYAPNNAPECAAGVVMQTYSLDRGERTLLQYLEGREDCGPMSRQEKTAVRNTAYELFDLD